MNDHQKERFALKMVRSMFNTVTGKRINILGFAFKKDTGDTRETAAAYICKYLLEERAVVSVYDPKVKDEEMWKEFEYTLGVSEKTFPDLKKFIYRVDDVYESCVGCHAVAVMTEWDMFKTLDYQRIYETMVRRREKKSPCILCVCVCVCCMLCALCSVLCALCSVTCAIANTNVAFFLSASPSASFSSTSSSRPSCSTAVTSSTTTPSAPLASRCTRSGRHGTCRSCKVVATCTLSCTLSCTLM